ncbi:MAG: 2-phosphosulfolactate phosphatase [Planctomycetota bacterium]
MPRILQIHFLPSLLDSKQLAGATAVIIDVLRASSTIITALANGATAVAPCSNPEEARAIREQRPAGTTLLGGERGGVRIDGFDYGNSPAEYSRERVADKLLSFTTTNGTRALLSSRNAQTILIGAFLNRAAIISRLKSESSAIHLVCAGTDGVITGEDVLFAGAVVDDLAGDSNADWILNDSAEIGRQFWRSTVSRLPNAQGTADQRIEAVLRTTRGGRNLCDLHYNSDIALCSRNNVFNVIPQYEASQGLLRSESHNT